MNRSDLMALARQAGVLPQEALSATAAMTAAVAPTPIDTLRDLLMAGLTAEDLANARVDGRPMTRAEAADALLEEFS